MKFKPKGRKIYRYQTRGERIKAFFKSRRAVFATALGIVCLVFVGYSAGGPVLKFLEEREIITQKPPESSKAESPSSQTDAQAPSASGESTAAPADSSLPEGTDAPVQNENLPDMHIYQLELSALSSGKVLQEALEALPADATHAAVTLKSAGGSLHYATEIEDLSRTPAVVSVLPAETICAAIEAKGLEPVAVINAFEDHLYPKTFSAAGYQIAGSGERWLDDSPENGGKPWLSPFSAIAVDYLETLTDEAADAGFSVIVCEGLVFPDFSEEDLTMLDPRAGTPDRSTFLVNAVNAMHAAADETCFLVALDGEEIIRGNAPIQSDLERLTADGILLTVDSQNDLEDAADALGSMLCIPALEKAGDGAQWFVRAKEAPAPTEPSSSQEP